MKPDLHQLWSRLEPLLDEALDLPPTSRPDFLARACGGDADLRVAIEQLIAGAEGAHRVLDSPALALGLPLVGSADTDHPVLPAGSRVGPYRLLREVGEGGMGVVYQAERDDPALRQIVALKVVRQGFERDSRLRQRFLEERQILASLHHPHIATLYDGGVTEGGAPWFAMEYVEGVPLNHYADDHNLTVSQRLRLFLEVSDAVQYAHQNLVVHRDLKPSNILVTADGAVKLLDFGIAKLVDPTRIGATLTRAGHQPFTPEYASPEQVLGQSVATTSDVYSLGVVLYELLTGVRPLAFADRPVNEWGRVMLEQAPVWPSQVTDAPRELRGDLDTILLQALRKEPARRYPSVEQLAEDIRRYLARLPVRARADTWPYRAGKFVRRHRWGVAATGVLAAVIITGVSAFAWQTRNARSSASRAIASRDFLLTMFREADPQVARGDSLTAGEMLARASQRIDSQLSNQPELRRELFSELGVVYLDLGDLAHADSMFRRQLSVAHTLEPEPGIMVGNALDHLAWTHIEMDDFAAADSMLDLARAIYQRIGRKADSSLADNYNLLGDVLYRQERVTEAIEAQRHALQLAERSNFSGDALASLWSDLSITLMDANNLPEADSALHRALAIERAAVAPDNPELVLLEHNLASLKDVEGDYDSAAAIERAVLAKFRRIYPAGHARTLKAINNLGFYELEMGDNTAAETSFRESAAVAESLLGPNHQVTLITLNNLGRSLLMQGRAAEAVPYFRKALAGGREAFGARGGFIPLPLLFLGRAALALGNPGQAEALLDSALAIAREALPPEHPRIPEIETTLGSLLLSGGRLVEADTMLQTALTLRRANLDPTNPEIGVTMLALARCRAAQGNRAEAESLFVESVRRLAANRFRGRETGEARAALAEWQGRWARQ